MVVRRTVVGGAVVGDVPPPEVEPATVVVVADGLPLPEDLRTIEVDGTRVAPGPSPSGDATLSGSTGLP